MPEFSAKKPSKAKLAGGPSNDKGKAALPDFQWLNRRIDPIIEKARDLQCNQTACFPGAAYPCRPDEFS